MRNAIKPHNMDGYQRFAPSQMEKIARRFADMMRRRKSIRDFSSDNVPQDVIKECLRAATSAPSVDHMQPWRFVAISNSEIKSKIRAKEITAYPQEIAKNDQHLAFLENAPWLIAVFSDENAREMKTTSHTKMGADIGMMCSSLAVGMLLTSIHSVGLGSMIYKSDKLGYLNDICNRGKNEKPVMLVAVGHPNSVFGIPIVEKNYKELDEVVNYIT